MNFRYDRYLPINEVRMMLGDKLFADLVLEYFTTDQLQKLADYADLIYDLTE